MGLGPYEQVVAKRSSNANPLFAEAAERGSQGYLQGFCSSFTLL